MIQREISELRRHMTPERTNMTHIYGCYVNGEKQIISSFEQSLAVMEKNDTEKYIELMKKALSGKIGRTLNNLEFTSQQVIDGEEHKLLMALRETKMEDAQLRETLCRKIIEVLSLNDQSNYLILLAYDVYDVPFKGSDRQTQMDNSDETFRYILCAVCPVKRDKPALRYVPADGLFHERPPEWLAGVPVMGFLFPLYESGAADVNNLLFFSRDCNDAHEAFLKAAFNADAVMPAVEQTENFQSLLAQTLGTECSLDVVQEMHEVVSTMIEEQEKDAEPLMLSKQDVARVLTDGGVSPERVEAFQDGFDKTFGTGAALPAVNVVTPKQFKVDLPSVSIKVDPKQADLLETRVIDGRSYLLIPIDGDIAVNGQPVFANK